ncbi:MAG TPA: A/G-specific adenine glycosylase [Methanomicrobiales archaeon]|nr:A/G-specific adenine glycosylase [Methanomicrobiales archaeon]
MVWPQDLRDELAGIEASVTPRLRNEGLTPGVVRLFRGRLMHFYATYGRDLPWRRTTDPYRILVSEFMLQQTQVGRVLVKYPEFLGKFPDIATLAGATPREVLGAWQGLGYNRRALALHATARKAVREFGGSIPLDPVVLESFPGIGAATAGAVVVFSTNLPLVFIETNIRRVFIHLFFSGVTRVHDREIEPILARTLMRNRPRDFYYALMDLGSLLMGQGNPNTRSAGYSRQSPFQGSDRQLRGEILRRLLPTGDIASGILSDLEAARPGQLERVLGGLERDGFIERVPGRIRCRDASG